MIVLMGGGGGNFGGGGGGIVSPTGGTVLGTSTYNGTGNGDFPNMPNTGLGDDKNIFYILLLAIASIMEISFFFLRKLNTRIVNGKNI